MYYVLGAVPGTWLTVKEMGTCNAHIITDEETETERLNDLPKAAQLVSGWAGIQPYHSAFP